MTDILMIFVLSDIRLKELTQLGTLENCEESDEYKMMIQKLYNTEKYSSSVDEWGSFSYSGYRLKFTHVRVLLQRICITTHTSLLQLPIHCGTLCWSPWEIRPLPSRTRLLAESYARQQIIPSSTRLPTA
jgi:hypothetical protein